MTDHIIVGLAGNLAHGIGHQIFCPQPLDNRSQTKILLVLSRIKGFILSGARNNPVPGGVEGPDIGRLAPTISNFTEAIFLQINSSRLSGILRQFFYRVFGVVIISHLGIADFLFHNNVINYVFQVTCFTLSIILFSIGYL